MGETYPVSLTLRGRPCLVVGGGPVAARKVDGCLNAGARVTVVAPELVESLHRRVDEGRIAWRARTFRPEDFDGMLVAFAATSDSKVNRESAREARARGVWINVADDPGACDFHVPAVLRRGELSVAVSTGGASPALAAWVRDRVDAELPPEIETLLELTDSLRRLVRRGRIAGGSNFRALFDSGILYDLAQRDWEAADRKVSRVFGPLPSVAEILGGRAAEAK